MYVYNYALFNNLPTVTGYNLGYLSRLIHVPVSSIFFYRTKRDIPLVTLIKICNEMHISISRFIIPEGKEQEYQTLGEPAEVQRLRGSATFTPIEFRHLDMGAAITTSALRTIDETCTLLNISYNTFVRYFRQPNEPAALSVKEYLRICDVTSTYPGDHIVDFNGKIEVEGAKPRELTMQERLDAKNKMILEMSASNQSLTTIINRLRGQVERLTKQNEQLKEQLAQYEIYNTPSLAAEEGGQHYA